jgi:Pvc16 N-terminal domain
MSNSLAIAAVTTTLQSLLQHNVILDPDLNDTNVTILPLDKARGANTTNQLNLFLYMIARNAAYANADMPRQVKPGESAVSPLPLNLYFLLTAFGRDDDTMQAYGHAVFGKAMSVLYDHPVLSGDDIRAATQPVFPRTDLDQQIDRVRITFHPLSIDELSKLWTGFSMQYRLSAAYEVGVTLIESTRATVTPLPVLMRGANDQGVDAQGNTGPQLPTLLTVTPPNAQPAAVLGDVLALTGAHLDGSNVGVRFLHRTWTTPVEIAPQPGGTATALAVQIPNAPAAWPAGFYAVEVLVQRTGETFRRATNQLSFALAPTLALAPATAPAGAITYTATVTPDVLPAQRATLMVGDAEFLADPVLAPSGTLTFHTTGLVAGTYWVRLRVDGVDSLLVDRTKTPPVFKPSQKVTVT